MGTKNVMRSNAITHIKHGQFGRPFMTTLSEKEFHKLWEEHCPKDYLQYEWRKLDGWAEYTITCKQ